MAVEAHHLHLFPSQLLRINRYKKTPHHPYSFSFLPTSTSLMSYTQDKDCYCCNSCCREIANAVENQSSIHNTQMSFVAPVFGTAGSFIPFYNPTTPTAASESSLTFNNMAAAAAASLPKERSRDSDRLLSFLGDDISSHVQQQMLDVDGLIVHHVEKVRLEVTERRKRFARQVIAAVEERVSKRLKVKGEEIERMGKLNWALEERIKSLCVENQIWRDLAQSNEATANVLRTNLEQVLAAHANVIMKEEGAKDEGEGEAADAESCCCGDNQEEEINLTNRWMRACRNCRESEPSVLLLPCRHLCLCTACAPAIDACPICKCSKSGSVNVNLS